MTKQEGGQTVERRLDRFNLAEFARWLDQFFAGPPAFAILIIERNLMGQITVPDSSAPLSATVSFLDAKGAATTADDTPQWASDNPPVADVVASADGLSAEVTVGTPGAAVITVTSIDTDGTVVTAQGTITVQPGDAVIGEVTFATP